MKRIRQEHRTGCGIACVAMLSGCTYSKVMHMAIKVLRWEESQRSFYTSSADLLTLLGAMGIKAEKGRAIRKWASIPDTAIVGINHNKNSNTWHWVVFHRNVAHAEHVLDPQSKREVRKDLGRMRLRSCIPIICGPCHPR